MKTEIEYLRNLNLLLVPPADLQIVRASVDKRIEDLLKQQNPFKVFSPGPMSGLKLRPAAAIFESGFRFGPASERELIGVEPKLVQVVRLALQRSTQDFCVFDGIRSLKEQQRHVASGTSKTMQSKHLDGLAVDLVPWINGAPRWEWGACYVIALAMDQAATELGVADRITWGGAWDKTLKDFGGSANAMKQAVEYYKERHPGRDFIDGPHFEWRK